MRRKGSLLPPNTYLVDIFVFQKKVEGGQAMAWDAVQGVVTSDRL